VIVLVEVFVSGSVVVVVLGDLVVVDVLISFGMVMME